MISMQLITKEDFKELVNHHGDNIASLYIPTQRAGVEEYVKSQNP